MLENNLERVIVLLNNIALVYNLTKIYIYTPAGVSYVRSLIGLVKLFKFCMVKPIKFYITFFYPLGWIIQIL